MQAEEYLEYFKKFYFKGGTYEYYFKNFPLNEEEVKEAITNIFNFFGYEHILMKELIRDYLFYSKGREDIENYNIIQAIINKSKDEDEEPFEYNSKELEAGKLYECIEYDFVGKEHSQKLRDFLSFSVNEGWCFKVEKKDDKGIYFYPYKDDKELLLISHDVFAYFIEHQN